MNSKCLYYYYYYSKKNYVLSTILLEKLNAEYK